MAITQSAPVAPKSHQAVKGTAEQVGAAAVRAPRQIVLTAAVAGSLSLAHCFPLLLVAYAGNAAVTAIIVANSKLANRNIAVSPRYRPALARADSPCLSHGARGATRGICMIISHSRVAKFDGLANASVSGRLRGAAHTAVGARVWARGASG